MALSKIKKTNHLHLVEISTTSVKFLLVGIRKTTLIFVQKDGRGDREGDEKRRRYEESWTKVEEERSRGGGEEGGRRSGEEERRR